MDLHMLLEYKYRMYFLLILSLRPFLLHPISGVEAMLSGIYDQYSRGRRVVSYSVERLHVMLWIVHPLAIY